MLPSVVEGCSGMLTYNVLPSIQSWDEYGEVVETPQLKLCGRGLTGLTEKPAGVWPDEDAAVGTDLFDGICIIRRKILIDNLHIRTPICDCRRCRDQWNWMRGEKQIAEGHSTGRRACTTLPDFQLWPLILPLCHCLPLRPSPHIANSSLIHTRLFLDLYLLSLLQRLHLLTWLFVLLASFTGAIASDQWETLSLDPGQSSAPDTLSKHLA